VAGCSTARFGHSGGLRTRSSGEGFALEIKQFLVGLVALGLDSGQLGLSIDELGAELHLVSKQVGEQAAQLIALGTHTGQFGLKRGKVGLKLCDRRS
jgi:hypothetical protein